MYFIVQNCKLWLVFLWVCYEIKVDKVGDTWSGPFVLCITKYTVSVLILPDINEEKWSVKQNMINHMSQLLECFYI